VIPKDVLTNINTKIILGNEMATERHAVIESAAQDLSDDDRAIASLDKGEAIISSIFTKFAVPVQIPLFDDSWNPQRLRIRKLSSQGDFQMKFAHLADMHIGAHREPALAHLAALAFTSAMDKCIEKEVDFVVISGDLFQSGIPDLVAVDNAVRKMREVREAGIPIYVIYGSHDYNPNGNR